MARKKSIDRAVVADVFKRILVEIEHPAHGGSPGPLPDVEAEFKRIDAFINRLMTTATPSSEAKTSAPPVEHTSGTKAVQLRIPNRVINAFRAASFKAGAGYQTLMIRALADAAEDLAL